MKLHTLSPAEGSVKEGFRKGRGAGSGNGKTAGRDTRVRTHVRAAVSDRGLKADSFRFTESFRREASTTNSQKHIPSSMSAH